MNNEKALYGVFEHFKPVSISFITRYGSTDGADTDLFIGLRKNTLYNCVTIGELDLTFAGGYQLNNMVENFDPLATEPIAFGELIWGANIDHYKDYLFNTPVPQTSLGYLYQRFLQTYNDCFCYLGEEDFKNANINLYFSLSFLCYFRFYFGCKRLITFSELLENPDNLDLINTKALIKGKEFNEETFFVINGYILRILENLTGKRGELLENGQPTTIQNP